MVKKAANVVAALILLCLLFLFFTNDFGLIDIHKTTIVMALGIDKAESGVEVTAQLAVPRPSQSGDAVEYTEVQGAGPTVADALNEVNSKTGFYPKLLFLRIVLLGESCFNGDIFSLLDYFYRTEYSELTPLVAACRGKASDLLSRPTPASDSASMPIEKVLGDELKKSGSVSAVNLKDLAQSAKSVSGACYMPLVETNIQGTSEEGGGAGGKTPPPQEGGGSDKPSESSGGSQEGSGGSSGGAGSGGEQKPVEFTCKRTVIFNGGKFAGVLDEEQAFAFNLVKNQIKHTVLTFESGGEEYTLGVRNGKGKVDVKVKDGVPKVLFSFKGKAEVLEVAGEESQKTGSDEKVPDAVLNDARETLKKRFSSLYSAVAALGCDVLGAKQSLERNEYKYFGGLKDVLFERAEAEYDIKIESSN